MGRIINIKDYFTLKPGDRSSSIANDGDRPEVDRAETVDSKFGMWIFLGTEILLFGTIFCLYGAYRYRFPSTFSKGSHHLDYILGSLNTFVLLSSSLTMALAVREVKRNRQARAILALAATFVFGFIFLLIKAVEYKHHYDEALFPGLRFEATGADSGPLNLFMSLYFLGTGLHAVHLTIGLGLVAWLIMRSWTQRVLRALPAGNLATRFAFHQEQTTEVVGLYWHFVDIVWVFLLGAFYMIE